MWRIAFEHPGEPLGVVWLITDHVCRVCFGRVLVSPHGTEARCADCGAAAQSVRALCACGAALHTGGNAGLRCERNPDQRPECPAEIVIRFVGLEPAPVKPKSVTPKPKPKHGGGGLF